MSPMTKSLHVMVTGATGFLGRALVARLLEDGHRVTVASRSPGSIEAQPGGSVSAVDWNDDDALARALSSADVVVHLAGESIAGRWTTARKERIRASRVEGTRRLVQAIARAELRPRALVAASAVGWYGDRETEVTELDSPGEGFLADVCRAWEQEARRARDLGCRVVSLRLGIVLGRGGGTSQVLLRLARLGLSGRLGRGDQPVSWIHLDDAAALFARAVADPRFEGPINAVAGHLPQRRFARAIAAAVGRPGGLPAPAWSVRLGLGEASNLLLGGAPVRSERLPELGVELRYSELEGALEELV